MTSHVSRRSFLKQSGALTATATAGFPLVFNLMASSDAVADTSPSDDYRALVCVFLAGGNDAYSTVLRTDVGLERYTQARNQISGDLVQVVNGASVVTSKVLPLKTTFVHNAATDATRNIPASLALALHPNLRFLAAQCNGDTGNANEYVPGVNVAVIGNIGPLVGKMTAANFVPGAATVPPKLFSHNDQQSIWQSGKPEGAAYGWGGELVRQAASSNQGHNNQIARIGATGAIQPYANDYLFSAIGIDSTPVFCVGTNPTAPGTYKEVLPFGASKETGAGRIGSYGPGAVRIDDLDVSEPAGTPRLLNNHWDRNKMLAPLFSGAAGTSDAPATPGTSLGHLIEADYVAKLNNANEAWLYMSAALNATPISPAVIDSDKGSDGNANRTGLKSQLEMVFRMIEGRNNGGHLAMKRQVFFVQLGGFDTHSGQTSAQNNHASLLDELDNALRRFYQLLQDKGDAAKVTTFTASEFGRKFNQNGDGTDHGWGGHHFVMGGAVKPGVFGHFPNLTWSGSAYTNDAQLLPDGTMVPKIPVDNLISSLGTWLGVNMGNSTLQAQLAPYLDPAADCKLDLLTA